MSIEKDIAGLVEGALKEAQGQGDLPQGAAGLEVVVERPLLAEHGDFATSLPLKLARALRMNPLTIAERIVAHLPAMEAVALSWAATPGFINFTLSDSWLARQVETILERGEGYGSANVGAGQRVQVEYVSVNPTGPLHVGHARGAIIGSTLATVLGVAGYQVTQEYYVNDAGTQMDIFYHSLYARYLQALGAREVELPPDGYMGSYLVDLAAEVVREEGDRYQRMPGEEAVQELGKVGLQKMMASIREDLGRVRVMFDVWFSEQSLYEGGQYVEVMDLLGQRGYLTKREGAVWFISTSLGEDKDNVLVRSSGAPTYFASDAAYHYNKFTQRRFDQVVDVWGADHQGHVSRMKAVVTALGIDPVRLKILITQMVALKRGEEVLRMSKRAGELITLRELVDEVGPDACRYFFLARSAESQMEFDLELAKEQSSDNPVYYIQYAHARIASILQNAQEQGVAFDDGDVSLLTHEAELALLRKMVQLPEVIEVMAQAMEPHHLPHYALELATTFHWFYQQCRVIGDDLALTKGRLKLTSAARCVLARCLHLMGMEAPERM